LVATTAFLAGCTTASPDPAPSPTTNGVEALEADEILERAQEALDAAKSYRIRGEGERDGENIKMDLVVAGQSIEGIATFEGMEFTVVVVEDGTYVLADDEFWTALLPEETLATVLPLMSGKYVKVPEGADTGLFPSADDLLQFEGTVTKGDIVDVDGTQAITLVGEDGSELYVAIEGEPYPLQIVADEGTIEFLEIDDDVTIEAPDEADVFDLDALTS
jgi:hypothetical protein